MSKPAYNLNLSVQETSETTTSTGKPKIVSKVGLTLRGRQVTRTMVAMGAAADAVRDVMVPGETVRVRCLFDQVEGEDGAKGGQFLTAIGLPRETAAAA